MNIVIEKSSIPDRAKLVRKGQRLQYLTIAWNGAEFAFALLAGFLAGSIALTGFGIDSAIEVTSSLAALWRLGKDHCEVDRDGSERRTLRLIGVLFLLLAGYILFESGHDLLTRIPPQPSLIGIGVALFALIAMPWLANQKRKVAVSLGSGALEAEMRQTEICFYLSVILFTGLGLNAWLGWWWADPVAGLAMVPLIAWEGIEALRGRATCDCQ